MAPVATRCRIVMTRAMHLRRLEAPATRSRAIQGNASNLVKCWACPTTQRTLRSTLSYRWGIAASHTARVATQSGAAYNAVVTRSTSYGVHRGHWAEAQARRW